jgi:hypothetical protein
MTHDFKNHKKKSGNMKLIDLIPNGHGYDVSKVYEGISSDHPLAESSFAQIKKTCEAIKAEIDKRYSPGAFAGVEDAAGRIEYILARIGKWIDEGNLYDNQDAEVFMDSFCDRFKELETMLMEIDNNPEE